MVAELRLCDTDPGVVSETAVAAMATGPQPQAPHQDADAQVDSPGTGPSQRLPSEDGTEAQQTPIRPRRVEEEGGVGSLSPDGASTGLGVSLDSSQLTGYYK